MSNEMIERVAKALCNHGVSEHYDKLPLLIKEGWQRIAKVAIKAMMEPTEAMLDAGAYDLDMTLERQYKNMIEAALKDDK